MRRPGTTDHLTDERNPGPMTSTTRRAGTVVAAGSALALALGMLTTGGASAAAPENPVHAVTASASSVAVGDQVQVTVTAGAVDDLYAYSVDLDYDPTLLTYVGDSASTPLSGATYERTSAGSVVVTHTKLGSSPAASGQDVRLVTATFTAVRAGSATVTAGDLTSVTTAGRSTTTPVVGSTVVGVAAAPVTPPAPGTPGTPASASTRTTLTAKDRSIRPGRALRTTVRVKASRGTATGTLTFRYRGTTVRERVALVDGRAAVTFRPTALGRHTLRVTYVPSSGFRASTDTLRIRVKR